MPNYRYGAYSVHLLQSITYQRRPRTPFTDMLQFIHQLDTTLDAAENDPAAWPVTVLGGIAAVEDYLSLRPQHLERMIAAVESERITIGPMYLPSPRGTQGLESALRNLMFGQRGVVAFGHGMKVLYSEQFANLPMYLPQLLTEFGITALIGPQPRLDRPLEAYLHGADGTRIAWFGPILPDWHNLGAFLRQTVAPHCRSGHLLVPMIDSSDSLAVQYMTRINRSNQSIPIFQASASDLTWFAQAALRWMSQDTVPQIEASAEPYDPVGTQLATEIEPLLGWHTLRPDSSASLPKAAHALTQGLWKRHFSGELDDLAEVGQSLRRMLSVAADVHASELLVRADPPDFQITAVKLPEDADSGGFILRGWNISSREIPVTLRPFRYFAYCAVTTAAEIPTGGTLSVAPESGEVAFQAAPRRLLTFWFHD